MIPKTSSNLQGRTDPVYTLSVASTLSGVPVHSIKQYINKGLILPYIKGSGRHLFSEADILRLQVIRNHLDEKGLNIAGIKAILSLIPCWAVNNCSGDDREVCGAYSDSAYPCWEAAKKGKECMSRECRECDVYTALSKSTDVKTIIRELVP